jgi:hypothetical protein
MARAAKAYVGHIGFSSKRQAGEVVGLVEIARVHAREECAALVEDIKMGELLLAMGELTAQEKRACRALLNLCARRIRSLNASRGLSAAETPNSVEGVNPIPT